MLAGLQGIAGRCPAGGWLGPLRASACNRHKTSHNFQVLAKDSPEHLDVAALGSLGEPANALCCSRALGLRLQQAQCEQ